MGDRGTGPERPRTTLLERTANEYRTILAIEDPGERKHRLLRLAERFLFAPENIARRQARLRALGYAGDERELWARGGIRGPMEVALERILEWLPELLESGGTISFPHWNSLVADWHRDWCRMFLGTSRHPKVSLDAITDPAATLGASGASVEPQGEEGPWVETWTRFQRRTGLSSSDVDALLRRVASNHVRAGVHPLRKAMLGIAEVHGSKGHEHEALDPMPEAFRVKPDVFWRRQMLIRGSRQFEDSNSRRR